MLLIGEGGTANGDGKPLRMGGTTGVGVSRFQRVEGIDPVVGGPQMSLRISRRRDLRPRCRFEIVFGAQPRFLRRLGG
jgi:hypothetical protein